MKTAHYICMKLIHALGVASTEQIRSILGYKNRHNIQVYVNEMKANRWIYNQRIRNTHYWIITNKGLAAIGEKPNSDVYITPKELKERAALSKVLESFIAANSLVTTDIKGSTASIVLQLGGKQWDAIIRTDGIVDISEDAIPTMLVLEDTAEAAWNLSQSYNVPTNVLLVTSLDLIKEHGALATIWGCNLVSDSYVSPIQLQPVREQIDVVIGAKEWKDALNEGSKERVFNS